MVWRNPVLYGWPSAKTAEPDRTANVMAKKGPHAPALIAYRRRKAVQSIALRFEHLLACAIVASLRGRSG